MPSKMSYLLFMFISSAPCQNRRIAKCSLPESQILFLEITVLARLIAEYLEIEIVSAVNQICRFAWTMKKKFDRKLTVTSHRHPTEKGNIYFRVSVVFRLSFGYPVVVPRFISPYQRPLILQLNLIIFLQSYYLVELPKVQPYVLAVGGGNRSCWLTGLWQTVRGASNPITVNNCYGN